MRSGPRLSHTIWCWWKDTAARDGRWRATRQLFHKLLEFVRDSMPDRRRQRYGDVDYDWEYRVDTTSATVGWKDRLLGEFFSAYQPTEPPAFHEMLGSLDINFPDFTFIDLGSGKGRTLLMASDYPFRRIIGVELLPSLHRLAEENIRRYHSESCRCSAIESRCLDARDFEFPGEPMVLYLFNPLPQDALAQVIDKLTDSLRSSPRTVYVIYHNPLLEEVLARQPGFSRVGGTHQYAVYSSPSPSRRD